MNGSQRRQEHRCPTSLVLHQCQQCSRADSVLPVDVGSGKAAVSAHRHVCPLKWKWKPRDRLEHGEVHVLYTWLWPCVFYCFPWAAPSTLTMRWLWTLSCTMAEATYTICRGFDGLWNLVQRLGAGLGRKGGNSVRPTCLLLCSLQRERHAGLRSEHPLYNSFVYITWHGASGQQIISLWYPMLYEIHYLMYVSAKISPKIHNNS